MTKLRHLLNSIKMQLYSLAEGLQPPLSDCEHVFACVNSDYGDVDWVPIRFVTKPFKRDALAGFYRLARIGLVTPLRDGMNLVAKEYVAAQDPDDPGILILSRFAGAASELDDAILVNPFDMDEVGDEIARALAMPLDERKDRWRRMMEKLHANPLAGWSDRFLSELRRSGAPATNAGEEIARPVLRFVGASR